MKPKHQRLLFILGSIAVLAIAAAMILKAFNDNLMYFYTPTMLDAKRADAGFDPSRRFRLGGMVEAGSLKTLEGQSIRFQVSDGESAYEVHYTGLLPTLFREGQGVVLVGHIPAGKNTVQAETILAKHDEKYMPPEVAESLKASGHWGGQNGNYTTGTRP